MKKIIYQGVPAAKGIVHQKTAQEFEVIENYCKRFSNVIQMTIFAEY